MACKLCGVCYKRWVSIYEFRWTPILTYTRRHLQLLDWLESHVDPVAFVDEEPSRIGVAIGASDLRLTIQRNGMVVESGLTGLSVEQLLPAIRGTFEVLEPKETVLTLSDTVSTFELAGGDYDESRKVFALAVSGAPPTIAGLTAVDGSCLVDLESDEESAQVEWGIVESGELLKRLNNPRVGRIKRPGRVGEVHREGRFATPKQLTGGLPDVGVFVETVVRRRAGGEVTDADTVGGIIGKAEDTAKTLALGFADRFKTAEAAVQEGATW